MYKSEEQILKEKDNIKYLFRCNKCYSKVKLTFNKEQNQYDFSCQNDHKGTGPLERIKNHLKPYDIIEKFNCKNCDLKNIEFYCQKCENFYCKNCGSEHKISYKEHNINNINNIEEKKNKILPIIKDKFNNININYNKISKTISMPLNTNIKFHNKNNNNNNFKIYLKTQSDWNKLDEYNHIKVEEFNEKNIKNPLSNSLDNLTINNNFVNNNTENQNEFKDTKLEKHRISNIKEQILEDSCTEYTNSFCSSKKNNNYLLNTTVTERNIDSQVNKEIKKVKESFNTQLKKQTENLKYKYDILKKEIEKKFKNDYIKYVENLIKDLEKKKKMFLLKNFIMKNLIK